MKLLATQNTYLAVLVEVMPEFPSHGFELVELVRQHDATLPAGIYFPLTCVLALETRLPDGGSSMLRLVGADGLVNLMDPNPVHYPVSVLKAGLAARLRNEGMETAISQNPDRVPHMLTVYRARTALYALNSGCIARHPLLQRISRFLLRAELCYGTNRDITLTQTEIARLLATRRETVAEILNRLAENQAIEVYRGSIRILKPGVLQAALCACFTEEMKLERDVATSIAEIFRDFDYQDYARSRLAAGKASKS